MSNLKSSIRDNHKRGSVGDFLKSKIKDGSSLSIVSAYFTIHAFQSLKESLTKIKELRFLYGEPRFIKNLDPDKTDKKAFKIEGEAEGLKFEDRLKQNWIAKECAAWIRREKVEIRSIRKSNLMHAKMYHIAKNLCKNEIRNRERRDKYRVDNVVNSGSEGHNDTEEIDLIANAPANPAFQPEVELERKELRNALQKAIAELPEQYRLPLVLRDLQGLSYDEISEVLELRSGTTKSRINRARLMLKDKLKPFI